MRQLIDFLAKNGISPLWISLISMVAVQIIFFKIEYKKIFYFIFHKKTKGKFEQQESISHLRIMTVTEKIKSGVYIFMAILLVLLEIIVVIGIVLHQQIL